ncbi:MAG TPA: hypothetical protein VGK94_07890 [Candidatus Polarisedimenticolia bacterium]|jgi:hypothetical protein
MKLVTRCPECNRGVLEIRSGESRVMLLDLHTDVYILERYDTTTGDASVRRADAAYTEHSCVCPAARRTGSPGTVYHYTKADREALRKSSRWSNPVLNRTWYDARQWLKFDHQSWMLAREAAISDEDVWRLAVIMSDGDNQLPTDEPSDSYIRKACLAIAEREGS